MYSDKKSYYSITIFLIIITISFLWYEFNMVTVLFFLFRATHNLFQLVERHAKTSLGTENTLEQLTKVNYCYFMKYCTIWLSVNKKVEF